MHELGLVAALDTNTTVIGSSDGNGHVKRGI